MMCEIAICDRRCKSCTYNDRAAGVLFGSCDFYLIEKKMRPCPAGEACTCFTQDPDKPVYKVRPHKKLGRQPGWSAFDRMSEETRNQIVSLYEQGYFDKDISKQTGVDVVTICRVRKIMKLPSQRKRLGYLAARERSAELHALR